MSTLAVTAIQLNGNSTDNVDAMEDVLGAALRSYPATELVLFSELCALGPDPASAQPLPGPLEERFCAWAKKHQIWLVPGSMFEQSEGAVFNTTSLINPDGEVIERYRKMYPFRPHELGVKGGVDFVTFDIVERGTGGISICYDAWFPETTRNLAWMGAEFILHPTMTNTIDRDAELAIVRASAICNQCWFVDVNGAGQIGNGRSIIVGPEGDIYHEAGEDTEIIPAVIDLERVRRTRRDGLLGGLGQPLKSFRDGPQKFEVYAQGPASSETFQSLGNLKKPTIK